MADDKDSHKSNQLDQVTSSLLMYSSSQHNKLCIVWLQLNASDRELLCYLSWCPSLCDLFVLSVSRMLVTSHRLSRAGACWPRCTAFCCRTSLEGSGTNLRSSRCLRGAGKIAVSRCHASCSSHLHWCFTSLSFVLVILYFSMKSMWSLRTEPKN